MIDVLQPCALVPVLETARLRLRAFRHDDFDAYHAMWADAGVVRAITGRPSTDSESWYRMLRQIGHWHLLGFGYWLIEERHGRSFVGEIGLADFHRDLEPSLTGMAEMGWVLASGWHGQGLATEAARAVLAWVDQHLRDRPVVCMIAPGNLASLNVAAKCGFHEAWRTSYMGEPVIILERTRLGGG